MDLGGVKLRVGVEYHQNISYQTLEELIKTITRAGDAAQSVECLPNVYGATDFMWWPNPSTWEEEVERLGLQVIIFDVSWRPDEQAEMII